MTRSAINSPGRGVPKAGSAASGVTRIFSAGTDACSIISRRENSEIVSTRSARASERRVVWRMKKRDSGEKSSGKCTYCMSYTEVTCGHGARLGEVLPGFQRTSIPVAAATRGRVVCSAMIRRGRNLAETRMSIIDTFGHRSRSWASTSRFSAFAKTTKSCSGFSAAAARSVHRR